MSELYNRTALFRDNAPLSCASATTVSGFEIEGVQPVGTDRRVLFSYSGDADAEYFKLAVSGEGVATVQAVGTQKITEESVLAEGNTVADLAAVRSIPEWVGKTIYPVIALSAPEDQSAVPTMKLGIVTESSTAVYEHYEESPVIELATENVDIIGIDATNVEVRGNGSVSVQVRFRKGTALGDYMDCKRAVNVKASAVQFRARFVVGRLDGTDSAQVKGVSMVYSGSDAKLSGETTELFFITKNFAERGANGLAFAQCMVRHKKLQDAELRAFVSFRTEVQERVMYQIGTGTGERQTIQLPDTGIAYNTVSVQVNGSKVTGYSVNTETNEIAITADKGMAITASYQYGWEDEEYTEMPLVARQAYDADGTEFASKFQLAVSDSDTNKTVTCIKFSLDRTEGDVTEKTLAVATGDVQVFQLDHYARKDTIVCSGVWTYDEATRILQVQHTQGEDIVISYHYVSESHEIYAAAAGWAKAAA